MFIDNHPELKSIIDNVMSLSGRDFNTYFNADSYDLYDLYTPYSTTYKILNLNDSEYTSFLDDIYDMVLNKYHVDLDLDFLSRRLTYVSRYLEGLRRIKSNTSADSKFFDGYEIFFKQMLEKVESTEHFIFWNYIFEALNNGYMNIYDLRENIVNDFFEFGKHIILAYPDDMEWWLPLYCNMSFFDIEHYNDRLKELLNIPEKYYVAYEALNLNIAEIYVHYKKTSHLQDIIHDLEQVKFV